MAILEPGDNANAGGNNGNAGGNNANAPAPEHGWKTITYLSYALIGFQKVQCNLLASLGI